MTDSWRDRFRPLNPAKPYYSWGELEGRLHIESECCMDQFSHEEELRLLAYLQEKHAAPSDPKEEV